MSYKLIAIDLDGTLVDCNGMIAEEDKAAVKRLKQNFVQVMLCTGRIFQTTAPFIEELGLLNTPHIMFDGALIRALLGRSAKYQLPLQPDVVKEATEYCRAQDIYLELYSRDTFFAERENWSDDIHRHFFRVEPTIVNFDGIWDKEDLLKAEMVVGSIDDARKAKNFADHFNGRLSFSVAHTPAYPEVEFLNITHPEVSKGAALKIMANDMGIHKSEIVAIGDGMNDISLFKEVGHPVAMGNATDEVKQFCEYTTLDIEHHGVAAAISHYFPM